MSEKEKIEATANALYDKLNPEPFRVIKVSKAECIRRVLAERKSLR